MKIIVLGSNGYLGKFICTKLRMSKVAHEHYATREEVRSFLVKDGIGQAVVINCCFGIYFGSDKTSKTDKTNMELTWLVKEAMIRNKELRVICYSAAGNLTKSHGKHFSKAPELKDIRPLDRVAYFKEICIRDQMLESFNREGKLLTIYCSNIFSKQSEQYMKSRRLAQNAKLIMLVPGGKTAFVTAEYVYNVTMTMIGKLKKSNKFHESMILANNVNISFLDYFKELAKQIHRNLYIIPVKLPKFIIYVLGALLPQKILLLSSFTEKVYAITEVVTIQELLDGH